MTLNADNVNRCFRLSNIWVIQYRLRGAFKMKRHDIPCPFQDHNQRKERLDRGDYIITRTQIGLETFPEKATWSKVVTMTASLPSIRPLNRHLFPFIVNEQRMTPVVKVRFAVQLALNFHFKRIFYNPVIICECYNMAQWVQTPEESSIYGLFFFTENVVCRA